MKKLLILSGKGGTGKTTTAAAFICFAQARAAADCDVDAPNLHLVARLPSLEREEDFTGSEKAVIDPERCIACGACLAHCRFGAIRKEPDRYRVLEHACEGCGVCALVCLQQAVSLFPDISRSNIPVSGWVGSIFHGPFKNGPGGIPASWSPP